jgi:HEAT repeat protein
MTEWGMSPRDSIDALCDRRGRRAVIDECVAVLGGAEPDPEMLLGLGGPAARPFLEGEPRDDEYWLRVWAARGLLWTWDDSATDAIAAALEHDSWRVREMALKVIARHRVGRLVDEVSALRSDPVPRVRAASERALRILTQSGA